MFLLFFGLTSLTTSFCYEVEEGLVTVITIYRHGDRTPISTYPNDPYKNASFWPVGFGQLTNTGKMQEFLLGQWLRNRYRNFLPEQYSETDVYVRSTNIDRTLMSAEANLAGVFPPSNKQIWNNDLAWQPIPVHTIPETLDEVLAMKRPCDRYTYLLDTLKNSPEFIEIDRKNQGLYDYLSKHSGKVINNLENMLNLYDALLIEKLYNFTLPQWTQGVFPDKMAPWAGFSFAVNTYSSDLARLKTGPLCTNILSHFLNSTKNKGYKLVVYSAHDITIASVLNTLQLFKHHCPPYGATILFELRHINDTYFVNVLYKNSSIPQKLTLPGCNFYCPLDKFAEVLKPFVVTPEQWRNECELKYAAGFTSYFMVESGILTIGLVCVSLLSICIIVCLISRIKLSRDHNYVRLPSQENVM